MAGFLRRRAAHRPVVIVIDDLHAADPSSLELLEYVVAGAAGARLVFGLAARDGDAPRDVATALGRIQRGARRLPLAPLARGDVVALVGGRAEAADAARVWELSEGNPLFVEELMASLASAGVARLPPVSSVRALLRDRVAGLPAATAAALAAAAVVGRDFRGAVVAGMLDAADDAIADRLAPARRLGLVAAVTADRYRFSHALVAEALADELDPSERARLHLRAAQALERRDGGEPSAVAHHLLAAGHVAAEAAAAAAERAAEAAAAAMAFEDAAALLERARARSSSPRPTTPTAAARCCARGPRRSSTPASTRAPPSCATTRRRSPARDEPALLARAALIRGLEFRFAQTDPRLVAALTEALAALGDRSPPLRARLLARLAAAEQPAPDPAIPIARAREALALAAALPDHDRLDVVHTAVSALIEYVPGRELEPTLRDALALAARTGARVVEVHTLLRLCFLAIEQLDRAAFDVRLGALRAHAAALGLPRWVRGVHLLESLAALLDGRFADSRRAIAAAEATVGDDAHAAWLLGIHRVMAAATRTDPPRRDEVTALLAELNARPSVEAWTYALCDDLDAARAALARMGDRLASDPETAALVAAPLARFGTPDQLELARVQLASRAGQVVVATMAGSCVYDLYDRALLVVAAAAGRWDDLDAHAASALACAARLASPVWAARVRADWADALDRRAAPGDGGAPPSCAAPRRRRGAARHAGRRRPLPRSDAAPPPPAPASHVAIARDGALWLVTGFGERAHVKDSRGMHMLARLVGEPGRELHALDLAGAGDGVDGGDAGELLDATARAQYRARLRELTAERDEAEQWGDAGRAERAAAEIEALTDELGRAVGLGGRTRRAGSATERARVNVQRRVHHALQQIRASSARLGEHLAASVHTGTYSRYEPSPRS